jgi:sugar O-acyltransferase (sialic acid O-acetyltransferase NeuD family)
LLLIGGGGHALSILEAINADETVKRSYEKIAIADIYEKVGTTLLNVPIIGTNDDLRPLREYYSHAFISYAGIGTWRKREYLYMLAVGCGYVFPNITNPTAWLSGNSRYGNGIFTGHNAYVNAGCDIGSMCILNTCCIIEHGCRLGNFVNVAPGATLCGGASVGEGAFIGAGNIIIQGVGVGENSIIGAGSVVTGDIPANVTAFGNPCRVNKDNKIPEFDMNVI